MDTVTLQKRAQSVRTIEAQIADLEVEQRSLADRNLEINDILRALHSDRRDARDATLRTALDEPDPKPPDTTPVTAPADQI